MCGSGKPAAMESRTMAAKCRGRAAASVHRPKRKNTTAERPTTGTGERHGRSEERAKAERRLAHERRKWKAMDRRQEALMSQCRGPAWKK